MMTNVFARTFLIAVFFRFLFFLAECRGISREIKSVFSLTINMNIIAIQNLATFHAKALFKFIAAWWFGKRLHGDLICMLKAIGNNNIDCYYCKTRRLVSVYKILWDSTLNNLWANLTRHFSHFAAKRKKYCFDEFSYVSQRWTSQQVLFCITYLDLFEKNFKTIQRTFEVIISI